MEGVALCEREHRGERENLREMSEVLKRKREGDSIWMDEMRERRGKPCEFFVSLGWERVERRESWEDSWEARYEKEMKLIIKKLLFK